MHLQCIAGIVDLHVGWSRTRLVEGAAKMSRSGTGRGVWGPLSQADAVSASSANCPRHRGIEGHSEDRHMTDDRH